MHRSEESLKICKTRVHFPIDRCPVSLDAGNGIKERPVHMQPNIVFGYKERQQQKKKLPSSAPAKSENVPRVCAMYFNFGLANRFEVVDGDVGPVGVRRMVQVAWWPTKRVPRLLGPNVKHPS